MYEINYLAVYDVYVIILDYILIPLFKNKQLKYFDIRQFLGDIKH
jgi:hypothetical protein